MKTDPTMILTTDHPQSSYGIPVLRDTETGEVFGPNDVFPQAIYQDPVLCKHINFRGYPAELVKKFIGDGWVEVDGRITHRDCV